jgi:hypothetical protein
MVTLQFCALSLVLALISAGATDQASDIGQPMPVTKIGHWSIECNLEPKCIAVGVLPPRKARMKGKLAGLEIEFTHPQGINSGVTLLPLDGSIPLRQISLTTRQAESVLHQLNVGTQFMIWVTVSDDEVYYVPGQGFGELVDFVQQTVPTFAYPSSRSALPIPSPHK